MKLAVLLFDAAWSDRICNKEQKGASPMDRFTFPPCSRQEAVKYPGNSSIGPIPFRPAARLLDD
jgi:hypothetical protein